MDDADVLLLLEDYKLDLTLPSYRNRKQFEEYSAKRWAADELLNYILSHVELSPERACVRFIDKMGGYARRYRDRRFYYAVNVADDILEQLELSKGVYL